MTSPVRRGWWTVGLLSALAGCDTTPPATRTWTPEDHAHPPNSVSTGGQMDIAPVDDGLTTEERTARSVYLVACAGCHGASGHGDGRERAPVMRLPDFASPAWQASRTDAELLSILSLGRGMMPAFGDRIPAEGLRALVAHVRRFGPAVADAPPTPTAPEPETAPETQAAPTEAPRD